MRRRRKYGIRCHWGTGPRFDDALQLVANEWELRRLEDFAMRQWERREMVKWKIAVPGP